MATSVASPSMKGNTSTRGSSPRNVSYCRPKLMRSSVTATSTNTSPAAPSGFAMIPSPTTASVLLSRVASYSMNNRSSADSGSARSPGEYKTAPPRGRSPHVREASGRKVEKASYQAQDGYVSFPNFEDFCEEGDERKAQKSG